MSLSNNIYLAFIILSVAMFIVGSNNVVGYEQGKVTEMQYWVFFPFLPCGIGLFMVSALNLYVRCDRELKRNHTN